MTTRRGFLKYSLLMTSIPALAGLTSGFRWNLVGEDELAPIVKPWLRSYADSNRRLYGDREHVQNFRQWFADGVELDGVKHKFDYDVNHHYQIANRTSYVTSNVYYLTQEDVLRKVVEGTTHRSSDSQEIIERILSGELKISHGVLHWHRHQASDADMDKQKVSIKLQESYYLVIHLSNGKLSAPMLKVFYDSIGFYGLDTYYADLDKTKAKLEQAGIFRSNDAVVVDWHELAQLMNIQRSLFYIAACFYNSNESIFFIPNNDYEQKFGPWLLTNNIVHSPVSAASLLNYTLQVFASMQTSTLHFAGQRLTIYGDVSAGNYYKDVDGTELVSSSDIPRPTEFVEEHDAFARFLQFVELINPDFAMHVGNGKFIVRIAAMESLVAHTGTRNSSPSALGNILTAAEGASAVGSGVTGSGGGLVALGVDALGDMFRESRRRDPENQRLIDNLNRVGQSCALFAPDIDEGDFSGQSEVQRRAFCEECVRTSGAYDDFADKNRKDAILQEVVEDLLSVGLGCAAGAVIAAAASWWCGGCLGIGVVAACAIAAAVAAGTSAVNNIQDIQENEAYIDGVTGGAVQNCMTL